MSIERTVAVLTPLFAAVAAWLTGWLTTNLPGLPAIPAGDVTALEIAGFTGASAAALKWLHGRAQFVAAERFAQRSEAAIEAKVRAEIAASPEARPAIADIEQLLRSHESQVEQSIDQHVPAAVGQALANLFSGLGAAQTTVVGTPDAFRAQANTTAASQAQDAPPPATPDAPVIP